MVANKLYQKSIDECEQKIINIYHAYLNEITPFIVLLETVDNEYPSEILNELRAAFTHLARYYEFIGEDVSFSNSDFIKQLEAQIGLAERHIKRCKLDCYKYACLSFSDKLKQFDIDYKGVDLSYLNQGAFIKSLYEKRKYAQNCYLDAKQADTKTFVNVSSTDDYNVCITDEDYNHYCRFICDDDLYDMYEKAYLAYDECYKMIDSNTSDIEFLKRKATRKDIMTGISFGIGVLGLIVGIIGIIIGLN